MTVRQMASYLNLNERTILKLVTEGALPASRSATMALPQGMIDTWLRRPDARPHAAGRPRREAGAPDRRMLALASCFQAEHVVAEMTARTKTGAIEELASAAERLGLVRDRTWFVGALIERENVLPSAVGNGLAFLHTLRRHADEVKRPFVVLGRPGRASIRRSRRGTDTPLLRARPQVRGTPPSLGAQADADAGPARRTERSSPPGRRRGLCSPRRVRAPRLGPRRHPVREGVTPAAYAPARAVFQVRSCPLGLR